MLILKIYCTLFLAASLLEIIQKRWWCQNKNNKKWIYILLFFWKHFTFSIISCVVSRLRPLESCNTCIHSKTAMLNLFPLKAFPVLYGFNLENFDTFGWLQSGSVVTFRRTQSGIIAGFSATTWTSFTKFVPFDTEITEEEKILIYFTELLIYIKYYSGMFGCPPHFINLSQNFENLTCDFA